LENFSCELMAATLSVRICEDTQEVACPSVLFSFMQRKGFTEKEFVATSSFHENMQRHTGGCMSFVIGQVHAKKGYMENEIVATNEYIAVPTTLDVLKHYLFKRKPISTNSSKECADKRDKIYYQKRKIHTR